jgi:hemerythrin superfamily protein
VPRSRTKTSLDAIDMLKQDHDKVDKAFKEFEKMDRQDIESCRQVIKTVCEELKVHTTLEEEIFYPAVRGAISGRG